MSAILERRASITRTILSALLKNLLRTRRNWEMALQRTCLSRFQISEALRASVVECYFPMAISCSRVLKRSFPSAIAGDAMHVSLSEFVAVTENFPSTGTT